MSERPLNERPAARPSKKDSQPFTPNTEPPKNYATPPKTGCFGRVFLFSFAIVTLIYLFGVIQDGISNSNNSSGTETYDVIPSNPDPRETFPISQECDAAMAASAADPTEVGEALLVETGNICKSRAEWEAALWRYPAAIGGSSTAYLDGTEFDLICSNNPELYICRNPE